MESILKIFLWIFSLVIFSAVSLCNGQGYYCIMAPNTLRSNSKFHVAVSVHKSIEPAKVQVGILGNQYRNFQMIDIKPDSTELVEFQIPDLKSDHYRLTAEGLMGVRFTNETQLNFEQKQYSVLVQTDKAIYKPNDLVHYRILIMDSNLKPIQNSTLLSIEITVRDGGNNIMRSYQNVRLVNGVYGNDLQLSHYPKFGEWSIEVRLAQQEVYKRSFEVVEYILPKFIIDIETSKHVLYRNQIINATITAYYAFGKPIVGEATISIYPTFFSSLQPFVNDLITRKIVSMIEGKAYFEFNIENELKLKKDYEREYLLDILVEEKTTGAVQNFSTIITVHLDPYKIEVLKMSPYYIPGIPFDVEIRALNNLNHKMADANFVKDFTAYLMDSYENADRVNKTLYQFDNEGKAKLKFTVAVASDDRNEYHSLIIDYMGIKTNLGKIPRRKLLNKNFLFTRILTDKPTINQEVSVMVRSNEPMKYFIYQVVGRGDILLSRTVPVTDNTQFTFKFLATFEMMPQAKLFVYLILNGEMLYDERIIEFEKDFLNKVQIEIPNRATPNQEIDIVVKTKPYSYVGLMAVDENGINLRKGNDLSIANLITTLEDYDLYDSDILNTSPAKLSGVITMTNTIYQPFQGTRLMMIKRKHDDDGHHKLKTVRKTDIGPAHEIEVNTLAPGKGRFAFSYTPKPFWHNPRIHLMHPPTASWFFINATTSNDGRVVIQRRLPSSMTNWAISAFAIHPVLGIALTQSPLKLNAVKNLYITTNLPHSIRLGETIALPFVIFNTMETNVNCAVTLYNSAQEFDFSPLDESNLQKPKLEFFTRKNLDVLAKSSQTIAFLIRPKRKGDIIIKVTATSDKANDTLITSLLVELPGVTEIINRGYLFELPNGKDRFANVSINIPRNVIPDSTKISISVMGDLLSSALNNLENLIHQPTGCGEQTMIEFMPNILLIKYLQQIGQLSLSFELRAKKNLELAYQTLLYYRHKNGAFSAFGLSEQNSSTWLTAYIAKAFAKASEFIEVDKTVILTALQYIINTQNSNGAFEEHGDVFEHYANNNVTLTAFVTLALLENLPHYPQYKTNIDRALDFIVRNLDDINHLHALALGTYVLSKANHPVKISMLQRLDSVAVQEDNKKWWNKTAPMSDALSPWYNRTRNVNIEITSYAILAILENNLLPYATPVMSWLMQHRNELGGFVGSQDTVVALEAIIAYAKQFSNQANNIQLKVNYGYNAETLININAQNSLATQNYELPNSIKNVTIGSRGIGVAFAQITYSYNTNVTQAWPRFVLDPFVNRNSHADYLHLSICANFIPASNENINRSNMAVMEVNLPSGFVVDTDTLPTLESSERIKRVETLKRNSLVIIYFDYLDRRNICPTLHAYKTIKVTNHQSVSVILYDYYDNVRRARQFYRAPKSQLCDICEYAACDIKCERAEKRKDDDDVGDNFSDLLNEYKSEGAAIKFMIINSIAFIGSVICLQVFIHILYSINLCNFNT